MTSEAGPSVKRRRWMLVDPEGKSLSVKTAARVQKDMKAFTGLTHSAVRSMMKRVKELPDKRYLKIDGNWTYEYREMLR